MPAASESPGQFTIHGHSIAAGTLQPGLHIVATPIGNLGDISLRALNTLAAADLILCEDTRVTGRLLERYSIKVPLRAYHDHNAAKLRGPVMEKLAQGLAVALVSDAGTPLISDPGFKLVREAAVTGLAIHMVPGPSAPIMALALSGLPTDRFLFCGFLPAKPGQRRNELERLAEVGASLVLFEAPTRIIALMHDIKQVLGDRHVALGRELTKLHEETLRGPVGEVLATLEARERLRGEITLVVAPPDRAAPASEAQIADALADAMLHLPASRAAAQVARQFGLRRSDVYARALAHSRDVKP